MVRVHWELREFLSKELEAAHDILEMTALTGSLTQAQALTCGDYARQTWPQPGPQIPEAAKHVVKTRRAASPLSCALVRGKSRVGREMNSLLGKRPSSNARKGKLCLHT